MYTEEGNGNDVQRLFHPVRKLHGYGAFSMLSG
jgi:hypothetical protein